VSEKKYAHYHHQVVVCKAAVEVLGQKQSAVVSFPAERLAARKCGKAIVLRASKLPSSGALFNTAGCGLTHHNTRLVLEVLFQK
jgi:hypothetical protein